MSIYLNLNKPLINFNQLYSSKYFVDKSLIIDILNEKLETSDKYICITRPRRFGKSSVADMLGAYYSKAVDSKELFDNLNISGTNSYYENLNKYNVISISFNKIPDNDSTYKGYINTIRDGLIEDLKTMYPNVEIKHFYNLSDILYSTKDNFIFILDEWDYIFTNNLFEENQNDYLEFLRQLLKDQPYVSLAYMTGVLPIKKYSSGSALNMFDEYTMLNDMIYGEYFGFTESEVKNLHSKQVKISLDDIKSWYNGYINEEGMEIYNPRSVVKALQNSKCKSYWTNTGAMNEVSEYLKYNTLEIREDVIELVTGREIDIHIDEEFRAGQKAPKTKKEIYSAMIILGFLAYHDGYLKIPNQELMKEFEKALNDEAFGEVAEIINNSKNLLKATVNKDETTVVNLVHDIHNSEIPILQYNDENSLASVISLAYLSARDFYRIEREALAHLMNSESEFSEQAHPTKVGCSDKIYADFTFHPRRKSDTALIVELKKNETVDKAIEQIKEKEYVQKFKKEYTKILAVAICYDFNNKEHSCKIDELK